MKKSRLLDIVCACTLSVMATSANAALVTEILGLDIDGTMYDVTFHSSVSFNDLWDANGDGIFGNDSSVFNAAPTFWGDSAGAEVALNAVFQALGATDGTVIVSGGFLRDGFSIPHDEFIFEGDIFVDAYRDEHSQLDLDALAGWVYEFTGIASEQPYVSFAASAVPVPAAVWLFGSGLLGLIGIARRKQAA